MRHIIPGSGSSYRVASVLPSLHVFDPSCIPAAYVNDVLVVESSKDVDDFLGKLIQTNSEYLVVSDAALWKKLVKKRKTQGWEGYVLPCVLEGFTDFKVVYAPIPFLHDLSRYQRGISTAFSHMVGNYEEPKSPVTVTKLHDLRDIADYLRANVNTPLSIDIETFSLKHWDSGIGTIAFSDSPERATAFAVDLHEGSALIRAWLKQWFERRDAWTLYHNATFDAYILLSQLWMKGLRDLEGMREGVRHITRRIHCSKIISYLALNSAQEISLSLKDLAQEFMGAWAVDDIKDIRAIPVDELLQYNGEDAAAALWVHNKHFPTAEKDNQLYVYENIFRPAITDIIEMQIVGIPFSMRRVKRVFNYLEAFQKKALNTILSSEPARITNDILAERWAAKRNSELKKKKVTAADWKESFNVGSDQQLSVMLFEVMGLPILETTRTGLPATDGATLGALVNHTSEPLHKDILNALKDWRDAQKLLSAFFPSLLETPQAEDGWHYLCGGYNIGGTLSGRLSSSGPNMQQLPATGARFARWFKYMFVAPPGWLFCGADFNALEDRIDALKTKDPNKLKIFTDGYDGHSFRAYGFFGDQMPDIDESVDSINSIQKKYKPLRQDAKAPYFALTYQGTWKTLQKNSGFSEELAKQVERRYKELYKVSLEVSQQKIQQASQQGYLDVAFGLRVRTPLLYKYNTSLTLSQAEGRTVNNAAGQSYGMLNNRAASAVLRRARTHYFPIFPCAQIHDAQYYLVPYGSVTTISWLNRTLTGEMMWQDWDEIRHPEVGLGGELDLFPFSWGKGVTLRNDAGFHEIETALKLKTKE